MNKTGTSTNVIEHIKQAKPIPCDCARCRHSQRGAGTLYCEYYDEFSPKRMRCAKYWCVKPASRKRKPKRTTKKSGNKGDKKGGGEG